MADQPRSIDSPIEVYLWAASEAQPGPEAERRLSSKKLGQTGPPYRQAKKPTTRWTVAAASSAPRSGVGRVAVPPLSHSSSPRARGTESERRHRRAAGTGIRPYEAESDGAQATSPSGADRSPSLSIPFQGEAKTEKNGLQEQQEPRLKKVTPYSRRATLGEPRGACQYPCHLRLRSPYLSRWLAAWAWPCRIDGRQRRAEGRPRAGLTIRRRRPGVGWIKADVTEPVQSVARR
ncbi:hypothetical protein GUJ93_ZPchr0006g45432 [Zizania palustris]|uniref:Uncharacterized protein n=1 Tax=Zizania palustris TaxID=103762 RepID=A0A8J5VKJ0_ZIZPA|nr:hypothetical protein GUJ93_ZPchr0006g45432 [Zizania palustris]